MSLEPNVPASLTPDERERMALDHLSMIESLTRAVFDPATSARMRAAWEQSGRNFAALLSSSEGSEGLRERVAELERGWASTQTFYSTRFERLNAWARLELMSHPKRNEYWNIVANGTATPQEEPTYAQNLNAAIHRAEKAEKDLAALRERTQGGTDV